MKNATQRYTGIIITILLILGIPQGNAFGSFTDVTTNNPSYESINSLQEQGVIKGYPDGTFQPDKLVSRAEFLTMAFQHIGYRAPERLYPTPFTDVPEGTWFSGYVKKALDIDVLKMNPDTPLFFPSLPVTRLEALKIIIRLEGIPAPYSDEQSPLLFQDIAPDAPYAYLIKAAQNSGVFVPEEEPFFFPDRNLTRGDAAEMLYRAGLYRQTLGTSVPIQNITIEDQYGQLTTTDSDLINNPKFPILLNVWGKINEQYLHRDQINQDELVYGAIDGMVQSLDDPYSVFEKPENAGDIKDSLSGNYEGIGTVIDTFEGDYIIVGIIKDSPAEKAGIQVGDTIVKIDGQIVKDLSVQELIDLIKGPSGSTVKITIERDGKNLDFSVMRDKISLETVLLQANSETPVPDTIGYVAIYQFSDSTANEFDHILSETLSKNPKGLILDLRDNPGGYVESAYEVLEHFVPKGETLAEMKISGKVIDEKSQASSTVSIPMVVLVNDGSASAAEIVAGALQDHNLATLVGEQTYGKGTVQEVNVFIDGSFFKLSIAEWLTPDGRNINGKGLTPDVIVKQTKDDVIGKTDTQLERAIQELQKL